MTDHSPLIHIQASDWLRAVTFTTDGKHILTGNKDGVRMWQVANGRQMATMEAKYVMCVAVADDGRWIAAGTSKGYVCLWDATTYKCVLELKEDDRHPIQAVDFSPGSARLLSTSANCTATVWDVKSLKRSQILRHESSGRVVAAKYSRRGDHIATATPESVHVWDNNGTLLVVIPVTVSPVYNRGLVWFDDHLFVVSEGKIKEVDALTGSILCEWSSPDTKNYECIALPQHGRFITCSTKDTITFWDTSSPTSESLGQIQPSQDVYSMAFSPDGQFLAVCEFQGKITIQSLSRIVVSVTSRQFMWYLIWMCVIQLRRSAYIQLSQELDIQIDAAALDAWKHDQLENVESLLTTTIDGPRIPDHHNLVCRALVRARLRKWDTALIDAEKAVKIQPSVIGYIAISMALIGRGDKDEAYRSCDISVVHCHPSHATFLLLIKAIIVFLAGDRVDAISRLGDLIAMAPFQSLYYVVQAYMLLLHGNSCMDNGDYDDAIRSFERARAQLRSHAGESLSLVSLITGWKFDDLGIMIWQRWCEALYSAGRTEDASNSLLELVHTLDKERYAWAATADWISGLTRRCLSVRKNNAKTLDVPTPLLREWAKATLAALSWRNALVTTVHFVPPRFTVYRVMCEHLEASDLNADLTKCILEMAREMSSDSTRAKWIINLKNWCCEKLESLGDNVMNVRQYDEAVVRYSAALCLNAANPQALLVKRSRARAIMGRWRGALGDANDIIMLDPTSPLGYERKHAALRVAGHSADAEIAFQTMLLKMSESTDPRERSLRYVSPVETESEIREAIQVAIRDSPLVLINTTSGRLLDKLEQASSFESTPIFHDLVCSMTTQIDHTRIQDEVEHYYRYATFSHKWKSNEPLYEDVMHVVVYDLKESPTHDKLQKFCEIVREAGFHWAWCDTVCINKANSSVLQEALVSMFQWYQGSTLTVVLLCDVPLRRLMDSIWNTRAWTFQEYHASKVVRFYNKDWTLYRGIDVPNHKNSPEIIAEMEKATGISSRALMGLRPGLEDIREKLRLASTRQSTRIEDEAYSLLGIFSISMPVVYGEGNKALGKLLAQLLTSSGDTSVLAWNGKSGGFNSCLPSRIAVFSGSPTSHIPSTLQDMELQRIVAGLREASLDLASVTKLCDRLNRLPIPVFNGRRMNLPSISFKLGRLTVDASGSERVVRARANSLGIVEIRTEEDLSQFESLTLVYPWIDFLLDRQPVGSVATSTILEEDTEDQSSSQGEVPPLPRPSNLMLADLGGRMVRSSSPDELSPYPGPSNVTPPVPRKRTWLTPRLELSRPFGRQNTKRPSDAVSSSPSRAASVESFPPPSTLAESDRERNALEVLARLTQPFGALLLAPDRGHVAAYRRVATESSIIARVQVKEITPTVLDKLIRSVSVLDVL